MPIYSIIDTVTEETFDIQIKYVDFETYFLDNPNHKQIFTKFPGVVDSVRIGVRKPDANFQDVLSKAKNAHLHSTIEY